MKGSRILVAHGQVVEREGNPRKIAQLIGYAYRKNKLNTPAVSLHRSYYILNCPISVGSRRLFVRSKEAHKVKICMTNYQERAYERWNGITAMNAGALISHNGVLATYGSKPFVDECVGSWYEQTGNFRDLDHDALG